MTPEQVSEPGDRAKPTVLRFTTASLVRAVLLGGALYIVFLVAGRATDVLWWFTQAAVVAALAYPVLQRLRRHMPTFAAILLLTFGFLLVVAATLGLGFTELQAESVRFRDGVPPAMRELESTDGIGHLARELHLADAVQEFADEVVDTFRLDDSSLADLAKKVSEDISIGFIGWVLAVMLVFTGPSMVKGVLSQVPSARRAGYEEVLSGAYARCCTYIGLTGARAAAAFVVVFASAELLGLDMPGLLAVFAALAALIPYVGIIVAALPVALMSLIDGPVGAPVILAVALVLQVLDVVFVQRFIQRRSMDLGLFVTVTAAVFGFALRGPGGAIVALVVMAMVMAIVQDAGAMQSLLGANSGDGGRPDATDVLVPAGAQDAAAGAASGEGVHHE